MAVEDAEVLGSLLSRHNPSNPSTSLPSLLSAYTSIRLDHCQHDHLTEKGKFELLTLDPNSVAAKMRDEECSLSELGFAFDNIRVIGNVLRTIPDQINKQLKECLKSEEFWKTDFEKE